MYVGISGQECSHGHIGRFSSLRGSRGRQLKARGILAGSVVANLGAATGIGRFQGKITQGKGTATGVLAGSVVSGRQGKGAIGRLHSLR
jgi:hypothetical protein